MEITAFVFRSGFISIWIDGNWIEMDELDKILDFFYDFKDHIHVFKIFHAKTMQLLYKTLKVYI